MIWGFWGYRRVGMGELGWGVWGCSRERGNVRLITRIRIPRVMSTTTRTIQEECNLLFRSDLSNVGTLSLPILMALLSLCMQDPARDVKVYLRGFTSAQTSHNMGPSALLSQPHFDLGAIAGNLSSFESF